MDNASKFINLIKRRQQAFAQKHTTVYCYYRNLINREREREEKYYAAIIFLRKSAS